MIRNVPGIISFLKDMSSEDLMLHLDQARKIKKRKNPKFPLINGDDYGTKALLNPEERAIVDQVHDFVRTKWR